jgi:hypothetical protein
VHYHVFDFTTTNGGRLYASERGEERKRLRRREASLLVDVRIPQRFNTVVGVNRGVGIEFPRLFVDLDEPSEFTAAEVVDLARIDLRADPIDVLIGWHVLLDDDRVVVEDHTE